MVRLRFPPLELGQLCDCARSDALWLLKLGHKRPYNICLVLLEQSLLQSNCHAMKKPPLHLGACAKGPSWSPSWQPASTIKHVIEDFKMTPASATIWLQPYEKTLSKSHLPEHKKPQNHERYKCSTPMNFGVINYTATDKQSNLVLFSPWRECKESEFSYDTVCLCVLFLPLCLNK